MKKSFFRLNFRRGAKVTKYQYGQWFLECFSTMCSYHFWRLKRGKNAQNNVAKSSKKCIESGTFLAEPEMRKNQKKLMWQLLDNK